MTENWKASLQEFFAVRSQLVREAPTALENLCYVSGRDPRVWAQQNVYDDLITDIATALGAGAGSRVLEVGCATGFLAKGVAPLVASYVGVDLAAPALDAARQLELDNAEFVESDGGNLPFADGTFDCAFCYNVFINLPEFSDGVDIIREMLRVVKPGGKVMVGSVPDAAQAFAMPARISEVAAELERRAGPLKPLPIEPAPVEGRPAPHVVCYYFDRDDFINLARDAGVECELRAGHATNPYFGFRFDAVYRR